MRRMKRTMTTTSNIKKLLVLVIVLFILLIVDLEVSEFVGVLGVSDNTKPIPEVVLLEVLLGEVLEVPLGEGDVAGELDLGLLPGQAHVLPEVASLASHLDAFMKILLEVSTVHDTVLHGVGAIDGELNLVLFAQLLDAFTLALEGLLAGLVAAFLSFYGGHGTFAQLLLKCLDKQYSL